MANKTSPFKLDSVACDVVIVGGGIAGVLTAYRLASLRPGVHIRLVEKAKVLGGRLVATQEHPEHGRVWGGGLNGISAKLCEHIKDLYPELGEHMVSNGKNRLSWMTGGKVIDFTSDQVFAEKAWKKLASLSTAKEWESKVQPLLEVDGEKTSVSYETMKKAAGLKKKAPLTTVLQKWVKPYGMVDILETSQAAFIDAVDKLQNGLHYPDWNRFFDAVCEQDFFRKAVTIEFGSQVYSTQKTEAGWKVETNQSEIETDCLVVTPPCWTLLDWLEKDNIPTDLLKYILKTKPISAVVLTFHLENLIKEDLDAWHVWVSAEDVIARFTHANELVLQVPIDFEKSLDAPLVVKAVKALRRAANKLAKHLELDTFEIDDGHLSLIPAAWSTPNQAADQKLMKKLTRETICASNIFFCGDSYGSSVDAETNLQTSVLAVSDSLINRMQEKGSTHDQASEDYRRQGASNHDQGAIEGEGGQTTQPGQEASMS